jgi:putative ABC transport system permease protein
MESLLKDTRYALRRLRQSPGFTAVAVAIIALGIGANTAIFSIVNAVLFRPQPYERPDELVNIYVSDADGRTFATTSFPEFREFRQQTDLFAGTVAFDLNILTRLTDDGAEVMLGEYVTADYWHVLGLHPVRGRAFTPDDDVPGSAPVAILAYQTWQRKFGGDATIVGKTLNLNGAPVTIVGIGPNAYTGVVVGVTSELWVPFGSLQTLAPDRAAVLDQRDSHSTWVRARLKPGVTVAQAQAAMNVVMTRLAATYPESDAGRKVLVTSAAGVRIHPAVDRTVQPVAGFLMIVVGLLLAIACSNLVNLLLARAAGRQKEIALRLAIGASRGRLVRQFLIESLALATAGGAVGLVIAHGLSRAIAAFRPPLPIPIALNLGLDWRVLGFTVLLSLVTGTLFGLVPALRASKPDLMRSLKEDEVTFRAGHRRFGLRNLLVVSQVAVSMLLLVGAGLFVRSLGRAQQVDPGFETTRAAIVTLSLGRVPEERARALLHQYLEQLAARPGVRSVALANRVPLGFAIRTAGITVPGYPLPPGTDDIEADYTTVGPGYFKTLGIPLLRGRDFTERDDASAPAVAIVSEAMARTFWGTLDVLGRTVRLEGKPAATLEVVGVARDTKVRTLGERPRPYLYTPFAQHYEDMVAVVAATAGDPTGVLATMRHALKTLDPDMPVFSATTMPQHLGIMLFLPRMGAALLSLFGVLAMLLASIGLYGVIAFAVSRRTRELGIRLALGARTEQVVGMVVREGMVLVATGCGIGLALALVAAQPLRSVLYGVSPTDPIALGVVVALLASVAALASYLPARKAARVTPIEALKT